MYAFLNLTRLIVSTSSFHLTFDIGIKHLANKGEKPFECLGVSSYKEANVLRYWSTTLRKVDRTDYFSSPINNVSRPSLHSRFSLKQVNIIVMGLHI